MFSLKTQFITNMSISCGLILIIISLAVMRDETLMYFFLWSIIGINSIWTYYYDQKKNGISTIRNRIPKNDERAYLNSFFLCLCSLTVSFLVVAVGHFFVLQNRGISVLIVLTTALAGILFCLYKIIRIVTTAPKIQ